MPYSTAERACIKMTDSRNRLRTAVDQLKQDINQSGLYVRTYKAEVQQACQAKIAEKPFHSLAAALAAGFLLGKWLKKRRNHTKCCSV